VSATRTIHERSELHGSAPVFAHRAAAGPVLTQMLQGYHGSNALVLAIPAGGVPVAVEIAARLALPLDLAPVSKVLLPWTTESGYGAVAFDGSVWLDDEAIEHFGLSPPQVEGAVSDARAKVEHRMALLRGGRAVPGLSGRRIVLVDDGIAAGSTMRAAIAAVRAQQPIEVVVAVPTGHERSVEMIAELADEVYCANIRGGERFAVAGAYDHWHDVTESELAALLERSRGTP
jgi:putative phosphoribosyl transferase